MIEENRILICCQGDNKEPFLREVQLLFKSLISFGGKMARSQKVACFTNDVDLVIKEKLNSLGIKIKIVDAIDGRCLHANKIQMLSLCEEEDFDVLVALDTDVAISADFYKYIDLESFRAAQDDFDPLSPSEWEKLYNFFGIQIPSDRYIVYKTMKKTVPYFNSGVLIIPRKFLPGLYESWRIFVNKLLESYSALPQISKNSFYLDQLALALAIQDLKVPYSPLPLEMNFPNHVDVHKDCKPELLEPIIIHHHHRITTNGNIRHHWHYENINRIIDRINSTLNKMNFKENNQDSKSKNYEKKDYEMVVDDAYREILLRCADVESMQYYANLLKTEKMSIDNLKKTLLESEEYESLKSI